MSPAEVASNPVTIFFVQRIIDFYKDNLGAFKAAAILITFLLLGLTVFFMIRTGWAAVRIDRFRDVILKTNLPKKRSIRAWRHVTVHFARGDENSLKVSLIEADNLLDEALRLAGYRGIDLGERLKKITSAELPLINEVWEAHKIRNRVAHETGFRLDRATAERALEVYQKVFQDLGILD